VLQTASRYARRHAYARFPSRHNSSEVLLDARLLPLPATVPSARVSPSLFSAPPALWNHGSLLLSRPPCSAGGARHRPLQARQGARGRGAAHAERAHRARVCRRQERTCSCGAGRTCGASTCFALRICQLTTPARRTPPIVTRTALHPASPSVRGRDPPRAPRTTTISRSPGTSQAHTAPFGFTRRRRALGEARAVRRRERRRAAAPAVRVHSGGPCGALRASSFASLLSLGTHHTQAEVNPEHVSSCTPPASAYPLFCASARSVAAPRSQFMPRLSFTPSTAKALTILLSCYTPDHPPRRRHQSLSRRKACNASAPTKPQPALVSF
jgi:hypothetical protein